MKTLIKIIITISIIFTACSTTSKITDENFIEPVLKHKPNLIYPVNAQENNHFGTTEVLFNISEKGKVTKTLVKESSGFEDLDKTAVNYCKGLVFIPAQKNGEPVEYGMRIDIKFDLKDLENNITAKIEDLLSLYDEEKQSIGSRKLFFQDEILNYHSYVIDDVNDCEKFNKYVYGVVTNKVKNEWKPVAESCPLSFLLYHDFIMRYNNSENIDTAKSLLEYSLIQDLNNLDISEDKKVITNKNQIIKKIVKFVEKNYPNINLDYLDLGKKSKDNDIS